MLKPGDNLKFQQETPHFQSYYSSIKTACIFILSHFAGLFQSYYSSIKTRSVDKRRKFTYRSFNPIIVRLKPPSESPFHAQLLGLNQRGTGQPPIRLFVYKCKLVLYFVVGGNVLCI